MSDTNLIRRTERKGTAAAAASAVLMEAEIGFLTDTKQLIGGDGQRAGGYKLTPDNVVAVWPNQADADSPLSLAWWIARADGGSIKLRLPEGTYTVAADLTVPANVYLDADKGAVFSISSGKTLTLNCEIGADAQPAITGDGTAVENYIRRLHINENLISHRRHLWTDGRLNAVDGTEITSETLRRYHIHSILPGFEIEADTAYTIKAHSAACRGYLVFYTSAKVFISALAPTQAQLQEGYTFTTPATAKYVAIDSYLPNGDAYTITSLRELGWKHLYKLEQGSVATAFTPAFRDEQEAVGFIPNERPKNDPEAARQLVACAESYRGRGWVYGTDPSSQDTYTNDGPPASALLDNGTKQIDCLTLMVLAVNGIPYFHSKYFDNSLPWRNARYYPWGKYPNHIWIENFTLWLYQNGWEVDPGINYSKLQAGDIVCWGGNPNKSSYEAYKKNFRGIDHIAMYTGRWVPDPNRNNELHPQTIEIGQTGEIVKYNFLDRESSDTSITGCSVQYLQMFARVPLETPFGEFDSSVNTNGVFYSAYYKPSVYAVGNGSPLMIDIYGRNYAEWEIGTLSDGVEAASSYRIRSGYFPAGCAHKNGTGLTAAGFSNTAYCYFDEDLNYLGTTSSDSAKYARALFKKSDNSTVSDDDLAKFIGITAVQKVGRDTKTVVDPDDTALGTKYPVGFHSYAYLDTVIPSGARLDRRHGKYAYTSDGLTWTELPSGDQTKLNSLRVADGENNVYVVNGQTVKLMRQAMD